MVYIKNEEITHTWKHGRIRGGNEGRKDVRGVRKIDVNLIFC